jgi:hypothetical protein
VACGCLTALLLAAAADAQDDLADIAFAEEIGGSYTDGADEHLLVGYRPGCRRCAPNCCTCMPAYSADGYSATDMPQDYSASPSDEAGTPMDITPQVAPPTPAQFGGVSGQTYVAMAQNGTGGYLDSAIVWSQVRLRFDAAYGNDVPDRAEFFYSKCSCFSGRGLPETNVDYQDISLYMENAFSDVFSVFAEVPVRFLNPEANVNTAGLSDITAGMKYALIASPTQYFTFQFRTYIPTGDSDSRLGTGHVSLEPGLLYFQRAGRTRLEGEVRQWVSVGGSDFAGNVIRYGAGLGYDVFRNSRTNTRFTPIMEWVGWTVFDGGKLDLAQQGAIGDASGDTIFNMKLGARYVAGYNSIYGGWGKALSGDVWYEDILRLEYRRVF